MSSILNKPEIDPQKRFSLPTKRNSLHKSQLNLKTNKVAKLFQEFFSNKMNEYEENKRKREMEMPDSMHENILIEELNKPKLDSNCLTKNKLSTKFKSSIDYKEYNANEPTKSFLKKVSVGQMTAKEIKANQESSDPQIRSVNKIVYLLKELKGFKKFIKFNSLEEKHIKIASAYMKYIFVPKGFYIFLQGDTDEKRFYGIIKGRISIRSKKLKLNFSGNKVVEEQLVHNDNSRLSYKLLKDKLFSSVLNTNNASGNKKSFRKLPFFDNFKRTSDNYGDNNIHNEIIQSIWESEEENQQITDGMCFGEWSLLNGRARSASAYTLEDTHLFFLEKEEFDVSLSKALLKGEYEKKSFLAKRLFNIKDGNNHNNSYKFYAIYLDCNDILFTQLDKPKFIYFIYEGECRLAKPFDDKNNKTAIKSRDDIMDNKHKMITHLKLGKGAVAGLEALDASEFYEYNVICNRDCTILLKIHLDDIDIMNRENILFLKDLHKEQIKHIEEFRENYQMTKNRSCFEFKEKRCIAVDSEKEKENIEKLEEEVRQMNKTRANLSKNNVKMMNYFIDKERISSIGRINSLNFHSNSHKIDYKEKKNKMSTTFILDNLLNKEKASNSPRKTARKNSELNTVYITQLKNDSMNKIKKESYPNIDSQQGFALNTEATSKYSLSSKPVLTLVDTVSNKFLDEFSSRTEIKELENYVIDDDEIRNRKFGSLKPNIFVKYDKKDQKNNYNLGINKDIQKTVKMWSKIKNSPSGYDSGIFNLPLLSLNK